MATASENSCLKDPNFAVICNFLDRYGEMIGLGDISYADLQTWLEEAKHVPSFLVDLHVKLLRRMGKSSVVTDKWERYIVKFIHTYSSVDAWEVERLGYRLCKLSTKLTILKNLLEKQFDFNSKFKEQINAQPAENMRFQPLGRDKNGLAYWYLIDKEWNVRVYREDQDDVEAETWEVVCRCRQDLADLIESLQGEMAEVEQKESDSDSSEVKSQAIINEELSVNSQDSNLSAKSMDEKQRVKKDPDKCDEVDGASRDEKQNIKQEVKKDTKEVMENKEVKDVKSENSESDVKGKIEKTDEKTTESEMGPKTENEGPEDEVKNSGKETELKTSCKADMGTSDLQKEGNVSEMQSDLIEEKDKESALQRTEHSVEKDKNQSDKCQINSENSQNVVNDDSPKCDKNKDTVVNEPSVKETQEKKCDADSSNQALNQSESDNHSSSQHTHSVDTLSSSDQPDQKCNKEEKPAESTESCQKLHGESNLTGKLTTDNVDENDKSVSKTKKSSEKGTERDIESNKTKESCTEDTLCDGKLKEKKDKDEEKGDNSSVLDSQKKSNDKNDVDNKLKIDKDMDIKKHDTESEIDSDTVKKKSKSKKINSKGGRKRGIEYADSAEESPVEPNSKKAKDAKKIIPRGKRRTPKKVEVTSSDDSDDIPLSKIGKGSTPSHRKRPDPSPIPPTRKNNRPVKKKKISSDDEDESSPKKSNSKRRNASEKYSSSEEENTPAVKKSSKKSKKSKPPTKKTKKQETYSSDDDLPLKMTKTNNTKKPTKSAEIPVVSDEDEQGRRRSARVKMIKAKKKEPTPEPSSFEEEEVDSDYELSEEETSDEEFKPTKGRNAQRQEARKRQLEEELEEEEIPNDTPCCKCQKTHQPEWLLLCDKCDAAFHTACLRPPLMIIPDGDWYCPPCEQKSLILSLQENLKDLDINLKKHDRLIKRKQRLAYVGISLDNILKEEWKEIKERKENIDPDEDYDSEDSRPAQHKPRKSKYVKRTCRQRNTISYKFEDFDQMIDTAIKQEVEEVKEYKKQNYGRSRGKDMANIYEAEGREYHPSDEEKDDKPPPVLSKKKKSRRLTMLDSDDDDQGEESEEFHISEESASEVPEEDLEDEDTIDEDEISDYSEDGDGWTTKRRSSRRSARKSSRKKGRHSRFKDFVVDDEYDSDDNRRSTRRSARKRVTYRDPSSEEEEDLEEESEESIDSEDLCSEDSDDKKKRGKNKEDKKKARKKVKIESSEEEESEKSESEQSDSDDSDVKSKHKKISKRRKKASSSESESDDDRKGRKTRKSRRTVSRVNFKTLLESETESEGGSKISKEKKKETSSESGGTSDETGTESEEEERVKKKKNVIRDESSGTDECQPEIDVEEGKTEEKEQTSESTEVPPEEDKGSKEEEEQKSNVSDIKDDKVNDKNLLQSNTLQPSEIPNLPAPIPDNSINIPQPPPMYSQYPPMSGPPGQSRMPFLHADPQYQMDRPSMPGSMDRMPFQLHPGQMQNKNPYNSPLRMPNPNQQCQDQSPTHLPSHMSSPPHNMPINRMSSPPPQMLGNQGPKQISSPSHPSQMPSNIGQMSSPPHHGQLSSPPHNQMPSQMNQPRMPYLPNHQGEGQRFPSSPPPNSQSLPMQFDHRMMNPHRMPMGSQGQPQRMLNNAIPYSQHGPVRMNMPSGASRMEFQHQMRMQNSMHPNEPINSQGHMGPIRSSSGPLTSLGQMVPPGVQSSQGQNMISNTQNIRMQGRGGMQFDQPVSNFSPNSLNHNMPHNTQGQNMCPPMNIQGITYSSQNPRFQEHMPPPNVSNAVTNVSTASDVPKAGSKRGRPKGSKSKKKKGVPIESEETNSQQGDEAVTTPSSQKEIGRIAHPVSLKSEMDQRVSQTPVTAGVLIQRQMSDGMVSQHSFQQAGVGQTSSGPPVGETVQIPKDTPADVGQKPTERPVPEIGQRSSKSIEGETGERPTQQPPLGEIGPQSMQHSQTEMGQMPRLPPPKDMGPRPVRPFPGEIGQQPIRPLLGEMGQKPMHPAAGEIGQGQIHPVSREIGQRPPPPSSVEMGQKPVQPVLAEMGQRPPRPPSIEMSQRQLHPAPGEMGQRPPHPPSTEMGQRPPHLPPTEMGQRPIHPVSGEMGQHPMYPMHYNERPMHPGMMPNHMMGAHGMPMSSQSQPDRASMPYQNMSYSREPYNINGGHQAPMHSSMASYTNPHMIQSMDGSSNNQMMHPGHPSMGGGRGFMIDNLLEKPQKAVIDSYRDGVDLTEVEEGKGENYENVERVEYSSTYQEDGEEDGVSDIADIVKCFKA